MNLHGFADAVRARLVSVMPAAITVHDGPPQDTPASSYCYFTTDTGGISADRLAAAGGSQASTWTVWVVCVGSSPERARTVASHARNALLDHRLDVAASTSPLVDISLGAPANPDGPAGDVRYSLTLTFRCFTARSL